MERGRVREVLFNEIAVVANTDSHFHRDISSSPEFGAIGLYSPRRHAESSNLANAFWVEQVGAPRLL